MDVFWFELAACLFLGGLYWLEGRVGRRGFLGPGLWLLCYVFWWFQIWCIVYLVVFSVLSWFVVVTVWDAVHSVFACVLRLGACGLNVVLYSLWYCVGLGSFGVLVLGLFNSVLLCLLVVSV